MKNTQLILGMLSLFLLAACASNPTTPSSPCSIAGKWLGADYQPALHGNSRWLMERRADGTFRVTFRYIDGGQIKDQIETGSWSYKYPLYETCTLTVNGYPVDGTDGYYHDLYEVQSITKGKMVYKHFKTGQIFKCKRVADDFRFSSLDSSK